MYSTRPKRGPIEALGIDGDYYLNTSYSTRPKRGPIEASVPDGAMFHAPQYSTRPKRGPIEAVLPDGTKVSRQGIPRVLSVAPLKRLDNANLAFDGNRTVFHAS